MDQFDEWNKILGIEKTIKPVFYDMSENDNWYSGSKSKEESLKELYAAWENRNFVVADV